MLWCWLYVEYEVYILYMYILGSEWKYRSEENCGGDGTSKNTPQTGIPKYLWEFIDLFTDQHHE